MFKSIRTTYHTPSKINTYNFSNVKTNLFKTTGSVQKRTFFKIVPEYMRGIKMALGQFSENVSPGLNLNLPIYHRIILLDTRVIVHTIPKMQVISSDNVTFEVDASIQYQVLDAKKAVLNVKDIDWAVSERCKMELRNALSSMTINDVLQKKAEISKMVLESMTKIQDEWGVNISTVQIRDIKFDESMMKAMSTVAEATRQAEAKIINAKSDIETAKQYAEAAKVYAENPMTVRLREFQLWNSVSKNPASTIFVVPSNLLDVLKDFGKR